MRARSLVIAAFILGAIAATVRLGPMAIAAVGGYGPSSPIGPAGYCSDAGLPDAGCYVGDLGEDYPNPIVESMTGIQEIDGGCADGGIGWYSDAGAWELCAGGAWNYYDAGSGGGGGGCSIVGPGGVASTCSNEILIMADAGEPIFIEGDLVAAYSSGAHNGDILLESFAGDAGFAVCWSDGGIGCTGTFGPAGTPEFEVTGGSPGNGAINMSVPLIEGQATTVTLYASDSMNLSTSADLSISSGTEAESSTTETDTTGSYVLNTIGAGGATIYDSAGAGVFVFSDAGPINEETFSATNESYLSLEPASATVGSRGDGGSATVFAEGIGAEALLFSSGQYARTLVTSSGDAGVGVTSTGSGPLNLYAAGNMNLLVDAGSISIQATDAPNPPGLTLNNDGVGSAALSSGGVGAATYITAYGDGGIQEDSVSGGYSLTSTGGAGIQVYETGIAIDFTEDGGTINIETLNPSGQGVGLSETQSQISLSATDGGNAASIALNRNGNLEMIASGQYQAPGWNKACTFASSTTCTATGFRSGCTINTWGWNTSDGLTNPAWCSCTSGTCTCTATTPNSGTIGVSCP